MSQALLIILAAALVTPNGIIPQNRYGSNVDSPDVEDNILIVGLIPALAFQSGIQIATSRLLGFNELPVNVLTSTYCDIMGDFKLMAMNNVKRNRRVAAVILLLIGAIITGWLMRTSGGLMSVLWIAGGIKALVAIGMFVFLPAAESKGA